MRNFRNIVFALAALLWLPASAHCQIEAVPGFEFLRCEIQPASSDEPARDCSNCCVVEKSQYRAEHTRLTIPTPELLPAVLAPVLETRSLPVEVSVGILTAAPPELPKSWHFISRAALPVRAPSFVS